MVEGKRRTKGNKVERAHETEPLRGPAGLRASSEWILPVTNAGSLQTKE